jgi:hypothetical protein
MRLKKELRPYQQRIATELYENDEKLCVVRPGGGKTAASLTAIEELIAHGVIKHALVIAPKRVAKSVWPDEIALWAHTRGLRYAVLDGTPTQRLVKLMEAPKRDITIIGIDNVQWLCEQLATMLDGPLFDLLVIDEVSRLRNPTGKRARELAKLAPRWRMVWGLTGTLRPSGAQDLFMPARVVTRGKLWGRSFYQWRQKHFYPVDFMGYDWQPKPGAEDILNAEIAPLTVTLADGELPQLPELSVQLDYVDLPGDVWREYERMRRQLVTGAGEDAIIAASSAVATGKLAQMANGFVYDTDTKARTLHDVKREWLEDIVENASGPTLLVYEFVEDLRMLQETLDGDLPYLGAGVGDRQAQSNIDAWNAGDLPFMALHPASGGHGLNLQHGGSDMAWIAPTWSPELWEQTIARLHRSGQTQPVIVRVCVARGTVDQMKLDRVHHKMTAQEAFEKFLRETQAMRKAG